MWGMKSYKLSRWLFLSVRMSFLDLQPKHVNYTSQFIILSADLWVLTCEWTCEWTAGPLTGCQQPPWGLMSWQELHPTLRTNVMLTISPLPTPIAHQLCVCVCLRAAIPVAIKNMWKTGVWYIWLYLHSVCGCVHFWDSFEFMSMYGKSVRWTHFWWSEWRTQLPLDTAIMPLAWWLACMHHCDHSLSHPHCNHVNLHVKFSCIYWTHHFSDKSHNPQCCIYLFLF